MQFKARPKPEYKFFEPVHEQKREIDFKTFQLCTTKRMEKKKKIFEEPKYEFKALKVPDFTKVNQSVVGL